MLFTVILRGMWGGYTFELKNRKNVAISLFEYLSAFSGDYEKWPNPSRKD